ASPIRLCCRLRIHTLCGHMRSGRSESHTLLYSIMSLRSSPCLPVGCYSRRSRHRHSSPALSSCWSAYSWCARGSLPSFPMNDAAYGGVIHESRALEDVNCGVNESGTPLLSEEGWLRLKKMAPFQ